MGLQEAASGQGWGTNIAVASDRGRGRALEAKCSCVQDEPRKAVHRPLATSVVMKMVTRGY